LLTDAPLLIVKHRQKFHSAKRDKNFALNDARKKLSDSAFRNHPRYPMRFTKAEVIAEFARQDRSYRLAVISTHWLRGGSHYKPSAIEEARGLRMVALGREIPYSDLAELLQDDATQPIVTSDFILNQLHALIRAPFELLRDYCEDYDKAAPGHQLVQRLQKSPWYQFTRLVRNAVSHNFRYDFRDSDKKRMPITWRGITLTEDWHGKPITYETFWHKPGYELFLEMRAFAEALPEVPV
jgi:hypothetical protein